MLAQLTDRGPDSAGVAIYRDPAPAGDEQGVAVLRRTPTSTEMALGAELDDAFGRARRRSVRATPCDARRSSTPMPSEAQALAAEHRPELTDDERRRRRSRSTRRPGRPSDVRRALRARATCAGKPRDRPHAHGDRERASPPSGSHPFSTGLDLCLVHNGSLSNHNRLRARAAPRGHRASRPRTTARSPPATSPGGCARARRSRRRSRAASRTSTASTPSPSARADGFAVLRDPIACKPAVMAETDDWVAMASEYRAHRRRCPASRTRASGSPQPGVVYTLEPELA